MLIALNHCAFEKVLIERFTVAASVILQAVVNSRRPFPIFDRGLVTKVTAFENNLPTHSPIRTCRGKRVILIDIAGVRNLHKSPSPAVA